MLWRAIELLQDVVFKWHIRQFVELGVYIALNLFIWIFMKIYFELVQERLYAKMCDVKFDLDWKLGNEKLW